MLDRHDFDPFVISALGDHAIDDPILLQVNFADILLVLLRHDLAGAWKALKSFSHPENSLDKVLGSSRGIFCDISSDLREVIEGIR